MRLRKTSGRTAAARPSGRVRLSPNELVMKNQRLAFGYAFKSWKANEWRFKKMAYDLDDVKQLCQLRVLEAALEWNPKREKFSTFATAYMKNGVGSVLRQGNAAKRREKAVSLSSFKDGAIGMAPLVERHQQGINTQEHITKIKNIIAGSNRSETHKAMFYQRFGLGGEEPKSALEISRSHNVSKQAVHDAINSIMEELTRKMRAA